MIDSNTCFDQNKYLFFENYIVKKSGVADGYSIAAIIVDSIAQESLARRAFGHESFGVQVVGALAARASCRARCCQFQAWRRVALLVAVAAGQVVAGNDGLVLPYLGHVGQAGNQAAAQSQIQALVVLQGSQVDGVRSCRAGEEHTLARLVQGDGAPFPRTVQACEQHGRAGYGREREIGGQVAELIACQPVATRP